ncbi:MAG: hypothetical protein NTY23_12740 [Chloroflexi bacterium]|nr:hypothetical protein [Chloroflexota bacterium]
MPGEYDDLSGIPLMGRIARRFVLGLFKQRPQWTRQDLAVEVDRMHRERGGIPGTQVTVVVVKKVLRELKEEGEVVNVARGIWRKAGSGTAAPLLLDAPTTGDNQPALDDALQDDEDDITIVESIGDGPESVYVYYNPNDRELADRKGLDAWECKIGRTQGDVASRIGAQGAKTALSHEPIIGLVIRTDNAALVEAALHASLRLADRQVLDSPGAEWYFTSPPKVKQWYFAFADAFASLSERGSA